jgi:hypothetical protein
VSNQLPWWSLCVSPSAWWMLKRIVQCNQIFFKPTTAPYYSAPASYYTIPVCWPIAVSYSSAGIVCKTKSIGNLVSSKRIFFVRVSTQRRRVPILPSLPH